MKNYVTLKLSEIKVPDGRSSDDANVSELTESIKHGELIHPITVRRVDETYVIICGVSRYKAYELLEREEIECIVLDCNDLQAELLEIEENLVRRTHNFAVRGKLAERRDEILDKLGLRAHSGDNQHSGGGARRALPLKTTADNAKAFGVAPRTIQDDLRIVRNLIPEAMEAAEKGLLSKESARELAGLEPEEQREYLAQRNEQRQESQDFNTKIKRGEFDGRAYRKDIKQIRTAMTAIENAMNSVQTNVLEILKLFQDIRIHELVQEQAQEVEIAELRAALFERLEHGINRLVPLRDEFVPDTANKPNLPNEARPALTDTVGLSQTDCPTEGNSEGGVEHAPQSAMNVPTDDCVVNSVVYGGVTPSDGELIAVPEDSDTPSIADGVDSKLQSTGNNVPEQEIFFIEAKVRGIIATGYKEGRKNVVHKGSKASMEWGDSMSASDTKIRDKLLRKGILKQEGVFYAFTEDCPFNSYAQAARIILAGDVSDASTDSYNKAIFEFRYARGGNLPPAVVAIYRPSSTPIGQELHSEHPSGNIAGGNEAAPVAPDEGNSGVVSSPGTNAHKEAINANTGNDGTVTFTPTVPSIGA